MKKQKLKNMFMATAVLSATVFALPQTAMAQAQKLSIDGMEIDRSTSADLTGDWLESGKVQWDAATKTLTLDNVTIVSKTSPESLVSITNTDAIICLVGSNSITNDSYKAIDINACKTTISGSGSLKTSSSWHDILIHANSTLVIEGCEVETSTGIGHNSYPYYNHLVVKNATLKTPEIQYLTTITLTDCHIQSPEGGKIIDYEYSNGSKGQIVVDADGQEFGSGIVIVPDASTGISRPAAPATAAVQEIHSLDGRRQTRMRHGVNIVKMNDGTTRKVICRQ